LADNQTAKDLAMATDLGRTKAAAGSKFETILEEKLERARHRIRTIDVAAAGLGLLIAVLVYGLAMGLADRAWILPASLRLAAFGVFFVSAGLFLTIAVLLPLYRRVNPIYAARELERTLPGSKNSVINWLDLRDDNLPPAIKGAVGRRAAKDLARADLERAVSARHVAWLGGVAGICVVGLAWLFFAGPAQFWSLMQRAYVPFLEGGIARQTTVVIVSPPGGNATVLDNHPVTIAVHISGRTPPEASWKGPQFLATRTADDGSILGYGKVPPDVDTTSPMLHLRYTRNGGYTEFPLEQGVEDSVWKVTVPANRVLNGFYYRVTAGDDQTAEYRIGVDSEPLGIKAWKITYQYPHYLKTNDRVSTDPNWQAVQGTRVTMEVRTNRALKEGSLEMEVAGEKANVPGKVSAEEPEVIRFQHAMVLSGKYRVRFTTQAGVNHEDVSWRRIDVDPVMEITFKYPKYLGENDATFWKPYLEKLEAVRGTRVAITYHADRPIHETNGGQLELKFSNETTTLTGKAFAGDPPAFSPKAFNDMVAKAAKALTSGPEVIYFPEFVLDKEGSFRLRYTDRSSAVVKDPRTYPIKVITDDPPRVVLTKPGENIELPANGVLKLEGKATDDFGLTSLTLRMQVVNGPALEPKPYRGGKVLKTGEGRYPRELDYKDFVDLAQVRDDKHKPFPLKPGMEIEYWLEATDNCAYPETIKNGQVGKSISYKVIIQPPQDNKKQEKEKQQAQNEQQEHEKKQDDKLKNQKEEPKPKDGQADNKSGKDGENNQPNKEQNDFDQKKKNLNNALNNQKKNERDDKGKGKGQGKQEKGSSKPSPDQSKDKDKPKDDKGNSKSKPQDQAGNGKKEGKEQKRDKARSKDQGTSGKDSSKGDSKGNEGSKQPEGNGKDDKPKPAANEKQDSAAKPKKKPDGKSGECNRKEGSKDGNNANNGQAKDAGERGPDGKQKQTGDAKGAKETPQSNSNAKGGGREEKVPKADTKEGGSQANQGGAKSVPDGKKDDPGKTKADGSSGANENGGQSPKDANMDDVRNLEKKLNGGDQKEQKQAERDLNKIADDAKDKNVGQAAEDVLKKNGRKRQSEGTNQTGGSSRKEPTMDDVRQLEKQLNGQNGNGQKKIERDLNKIADDAKDPKVREAAEDLLKKKGLERKDNALGNGKGDQDPKKGRQIPDKGKGKEGKQEQGNGKQGPKDTITGKPKNSGKKDGPETKVKGPGPNHKGEFPERDDADNNPARKGPDPKRSDRAGGLNLKNLLEELSKMSPEQRRQLLKDLKMTDKELADWQRQAKDYLKQQDDKKGIDPGKRGNEHGKNARNSKPIKIDGGNGKDDKISSGRGKPPPEYAGVENTKPPER
jgi:hypothetical protein